MSDVLLTRVRDALLTRVGHTVPGVPRGAGVDVGPGVAVPAGVTGAIHRDPEVTEDWNELDTLTLPLPPPPHPVRSPPHPVRSLPLPHTVTKTGYGTGTVGEGRRPPRNL